MSTAPEKQLKPAQFVGMLALLFAIVAFSIDAMLPAIPAIASQITPDDPNFAQLVITGFMLVATNPQGCITSLGIDKLF